MDRHKVLCSLAYSSVRYLGTALDRSFLNRIVPFLCAVMLGDGDGHMCEWEIHKYPHPSIYLNGRRK